MLKELASELGMDDTSAHALARLAPADAEQLLLAVRAARAAQQVTIQQAIDDAMSHVPALLRGALRRILF